MGRRKLETVRVRSLKLPSRLWDLLSKASEDRGLKVNGLMWRIIEDWLVKYGYLKDEDRKRESLTNIGRGL